MSRNTLLKEPGNSTEDKVNNDAAENALPTGPGTATSGGTAGGSSNPTSRR